MSFLLGKMVNAKLKIKKIKNKSPSYILVCSPSLEIFLSHQST